AQLGHRRVEIVTDEREFVPRHIAGMDAELGGRQLENQPAVRRVVALDRAPADQVAEGLAEPLSLRRIEGDVRSDDRHAVMLRLEWDSKPRRLLETFPNRVASPVL